MDIKQFELKYGGTSVATGSGLVYIVMRAGNGTLQPKPTDTVKVHYMGCLTDGTKFDSSYDRGKAIEFPLNRVIRGWTEGVGLMTTGAKFALLIPPALGYGATGAGDLIPPNSTLIFEVELLEIK